MDGVYHRFQGQKGTGSAYNELIWEIPVDIVASPGFRSVLVKRFHDAQVGTTPLSQYFRD
jgi:hypothetical protein